MPDLTGQSGLPARPRHPWLLLAAQIAGLSATGWLIWSWSVVPRLGRQPLTMIAREALIHSLLACFWSLAITLSLYFAISRSIRGVGLRTALRVSATAVWFAPATMLLTELSPASVGAAFILVVSTARLLFHEWRSVNAKRQPASPVTPTRELFEPPAAPVRLRDVLPAWITAFTAQSAVVAMLMRLPMLAAVMLCWFAAMLTILWMAKGAGESRPPRSLPRTAMGLILTIILSAGLTVGGLSRHIALDPQPSDGFPGSGHRSFIESLRQLLERLFPREHPQGAPQTATRLYLPRGGNSTIVDKSFPGVILWTEAPPPKPLIAPVPQVMPGAITAEPSSPARIPFTGEYWMFRPPNSRPPEQAYSRRGSPLILSYMTTDRIAMIMQARQTLDHAIDLQCCTAIWLAISNADRFPGTVQLELILTDSRQRKSQSLGMQDVQSRPSGNYWRGPLTPSQETLKFPVPSGAAIREFDELEVVFHRSRLRDERSAKISIDQWILVPR